MGYDKVPELEKWYDENYGVITQKKKRTQKDMFNATTMPLPLFGITTMTIPNTYETRNLDLHFELNIRERIHEMLEPDIYAGTMMKKQEPFEPQWKR